MNNVIVKIPEEPACADHIQPMKLWILAPLSQRRWPLIDCAQGMVVAERDEIAARAVAATAAGDEGADVWINPARSTCEELLPGDTGRVVLRDFYGT